VGAGLVAVMARDALPVWAGLAILLRDGAVLVVGAALLAGRGIRIDVRFLGKSATATLMVAITWIAWGNFGLALDDAALAAGWVLFGLGIVASYLAAAWYLGDILRARAAPAPPRG
jgi:phosphatidylglycerophosphate synthase